ncbi:HAD family hydrolase [bacterium]|nr:HAD family hydrolase [bacterium]
MGAFFQRVDLSGTRLFLFDWSGTISDDRRPVFASNQRMRAHYGLPPVESFEHWLANCSSNAFDHFREAGVVATEREVNELYRATLTNVVAEGIVPDAYGDARTAMTRLSETNVPIGIVSSHPSEHLRAESERYGIREHLRVIQGDCADKTPHLERVCAEFGVRPTEAFYVGDTTYDIRAAKRAGLVSIGITTGYHAHGQLGAEEPDALFPSLTALANAVVG